MLRLAWRQHHHQHQLILTLVASLLVALANVKSLASEHQVSSSLRSSNLDNRPGEFVRSATLNKLARNRADHRQAQGNQSKLEITPMTRSEERNNIKKLILNLSDAINAPKFVDQYLLRSKVLDYLTYAENYIILVPDDKALANLGVRAKAMLESQFEEVILFHVAKGDLERLYTFERYQKLETLNGKTGITFHWRRRNGKLLVYNALVRDGIQKNNIAMLLMDELLLPPQGTFWQVISKSPRLTNYFKIISKFGPSGFNQLLVIDREVADNSQLTIFAPSDVAFQQLNRTDHDYLNRDRYLRQRLISRHVCSPMTFLATAYWTYPATWKEIGHPSIDIYNGLDEEIVLRISELNNYYTAARFAINDVEMPHEYELTTQGVLYIIDGFL